MPTLIYKKKKFPSEKILTKNCEWNWALEGAQKRGEWTSSQPSHYLLNIKPKYKKYFLWFDFRWKKKFVNRFAMNLWIRKFYYYDSNDSNYWARNGTLIFWKALVPYA